MSKIEKTSANSLAEANRNRGEFSGHGGALGAAGHRALNFDPKNCELLQKPGDCVSITPGPDGFDHILIGGAWDMRKRAVRNPFMRLFQKAYTAGVDLDLGCLYELHDGTRGAIQAFGEKYGAFGNAPFIAHSGDERTGKSRGFDERIHVNGQNWDKIRRILVYMYIYDGAPSWAHIAPRVIVDVPGEQDLALSLSVTQDHLPLCAIGGLENVRGGIKLINYSEYFPGHAEMDRAFGFGLDWQEGQKPR